MDHIFEGLESVDYVEEVEGVEDGADLEPEDGEEDVDQEVLESRVA